MDFQVWFNQIPIVSKFYLITVFITTAVVSFGIINPSSLLLYFDIIWSKWQFWRLLTNFFFVGKFGGNFLFTLIMAYFSFSKLEKLYSPSKYSEFFYLLLVNAVFLTILGLIFEIPVLAGSFFFSVLYIWCKRVPFERVQFFFGFLVTSAYLPWVILGFNVITGGGIFSDLIGLASGHLYIVLKDILPNSHGWNILKTPVFFEKLVNKFFYRRGFRIIPPAEHQNPNANNQGGGGGFAAFAGRGVRLG